jgi:hypothetical protein
MGPQHGHGIGHRGWLLADWGVREANQRARVYRLTSAGKAQLSRDRDRWSQLVDAIGRVMSFQANEEWDAVPEVDGSQDESDRLSHLWLSRCSPMRGRRKSRRPATMRC